MRNNFKIMHDTSFQLTVCPGRDRYREASRSSFISCFFISAIILGSLLSYSQFPVVAAANQPANLVSIEYLEPLPVEEQQAPAVKEPPQKEVEEPTIPQTPQEIKPDPKAWPRQAEKQKPANKIKKPNKPVLSKSAKSSSYAPRKSQAAPNTSKLNSDQFINNFLTLVEKNKYYPKNARRAGLTGTVKVKITFDANGKITSAKLAPGNYHQTLGEAALATIEKAKRHWNPAGGGPQSLTIPINFKLN